MIVVSPMSRVSELVSRYAPDRVRCLLDPGMEFPALGSEYAGRRLRSSFHDAHATLADESAPSSDHVQRILTFLQEWNCRRPVLVHCRAGIGRSAAVGYVAACHSQPIVAEQRIAWLFERRQSVHDRINCLSGWPMTSWVEAVE